MISDLTKLKIPEVNSTLSFNILLHVTILFTILSLFFTHYITKISSKIINNEIKHIVEDNISKSSESINKMKEKLFENIILQNNLIEQFENSDNNNEKITLKNQIETTYNIINDLKDKVDLEVPSNLISQLNLKDNLISQLNLPANIINNLKDKIKSENVKQYFPYDYYHSLFSKEDPMRQSVNNEVLFYIKFTNILLILFLLLFAFYLLKTKSITMDQIKEIGIENILTFICVGAIEFLFFTNVAMKYIPTDPSLISKSLIGFLRK
jgi:hypothetical protein